MSETENAVELHVVSQDNEDVMQLLEDYCNLQGWKIIRLFWRNIEAEEWEILDNA